VEVLAAGDPVDQMMEIEGEIVKAEVPEEGVLEEGVVEEAEMEGMKEATEATLEQEIEAL